MITYGNRIDKLEKIVWWKFSTKVLQITILDINDWDGIRVNQNSKENSSLKQNSFLHNQIYTWYYQSKIAQKGQEEEF